MTLPDALISAFPDGSAQLGPMQFMAVGAVGNIKRRVADGEFERWDATGLTMSSLQSDRWQVAGTEKGLPTIKKLLAAWFPGSALDGQDRVTLPGVFQLKPDVQHGLKLSDLKL